MSPIPPLVIHVHARFLWGTIWKNQLPKGYQ
jgi:hypothetical protein